MKTRLSMACAMFFAASIFGSAHTPAPSAGSGSDAVAAKPAQEKAREGDVEILSDTQGVDFSGWLKRWHALTEKTWKPLIPEQVNPPALKKGAVMIRLKVLPSGRVVDMKLEGRSGDVGLDRAAWGAITGSSYLALPDEFHGPYLELRAYFLYNMKPPQKTPLADPPNL